MVFVTLGTLHITLRLRAQCGSALSRVLANPRNPSHKFREYMDSQQLSEIKDKQLRIQGKSPLRYYMKYLGTGALAKKFDPWTRTQMRYSAKISHTHNMTLKTLN